MFGGISAICPQSPSVGNHIQEVAATTMVNTIEIKITTPDNLSYVSIFINVNFNPSNARFSGGALAPSAATAC